MDRRNFLRLAAGAAAGAFVGGCSSTSSSQPRASGAPSLLPTPSGTPSGAVRAFTLNAQQATVDLGRLQVPTWTYGGELPGREIRVRKGEVIEARVVNWLPTDTSVHWHGLVLPNEMDGVPGTTQQPIAAGAEFVYRIPTPHAGTYWFHPHTGLQLERGLYAPLIIEDPADGSTYDEEWVVVLDDWLDGVNGTTPEAVWAQLRSGMDHGGMSGMSGMDHGSMSSTPSPTASAGGMAGMDHSAMSHAGMAMSPTPTPTPTVDPMVGMDHSAMGHADMVTPSPSPSPTATVAPMAGMDHSAMGHGAMTIPGAPTASPSAVPAAGMLMGATSPLLGGDAGDVAYPYFLVNGRTPLDPRTFEGRPGQRVRIRMINAGGDTAFRVAIGGHQMIVTHTDGFPVKPVTADAVLIGMGERYDVVVTLQDGAFPFVAVAEGKNQSGFAILRTSAAAAAPAADVRPDELNRAVLRYDQLVPADGYALPQRPVDREHRLELAGGMAKYDWTINGKPFSSADPFMVARGQRVRLTVVNTTTMWHPMHLHGHTFQLNSGGPRKDTVAVLPKQTVTWDFDADNPGQWMVHCHNSYHLEAGMMGVVRYEG